MNAAHLTPKQVQALPLLARGMLASDVAQQVGVSPQQISAWRKDHVFTSALAALRWEALCNAISSLQCLSAEAAAGMGRLIREASDERVRFAACKYVLEITGLDWGREGFAWQIDSKSKPGI